MENIEVKNIHKVDKSIIHFLLSSIFTLYYFIIRIFVLTNKDNIRNLSSVKIVGSIIDYLMFISALILLFILIVLIFNKNNSKLMIFLKSIKDLFLKIIEYIEVIPITISIMVSIFSFVCSFATVNGISMENTLHSGDIVLINYIEEVDVGDIVVVYVNPNDNSYVRTDDDYIKRVIAKEGDTITYIDNVLTINGKVVDESIYLDEESINNNSGAFFNTINYVVPSGCYFVMGDNRNHSVDSRLIGCIKKENIVGVASLAPEFIQNMAGGTK